MQLAKTLSIIANDSDIISHSESKRRMPKVVTPFQKRYFLDFIDPHIKNGYILMILFLVSCSSKKQDDPSVLYFPQVKTILEINCVSCHSLGGNGSPKGLPILLETDDQIAAASSNIKSATIDAITPLNKRMPLSGELSEADKNIILKWYQAGGKVSN